MDRDQSLTEGGTRPDSAVREWRAGTPAASTVEAIGRSRALLAASAESLDRSEAALRRSFVRSGDLRPKPEGKPATARIRALRQWLAGRRCTRSPWLGTTGPDPDGKFTRSCSNICSNTRYGRRRDQ
jgi:hypothetical protein